MEKSRRKFLTVISASLIGAATRNNSAQASAPQQQPTPGAPPTTGTRPLVGPEISATTIRQAEKLVQLTMSENEIEVAASSWRRGMAHLYERRTGPRKWNWRLRLLRLPSGTRCCLT
jgi:hypothetical protein